MNIDNLHTITKSINEFSSEERRVWIRNIFFSVAIHLLVFISLIIVYKLNNSNSRINPEYLFLQTKEYESKYELVKDDKDNIDKNDQIEGKQNDIFPENKSAYAIALSELKADTTNLDQIYKESTLNISIKYPKGWAFIDQNRNNKLDGVTFWATDASINPPPYLHFEVMDKYLFNEKRYKYKLDLEECPAYYNDPEELSGQVTQVFYLRTDTDEDYLVKLIINGKQQFDSFQPKFLGILKSFHFGSTFF